MKKLILLFLFGILLVCGCVICGSTWAYRSFAPDLSAELPSDCPNVAVSQDAAIRFLTKVVTAGQQAAQTRSVRLTVTQEELTSLVALGAQFSEQLQALQHLQNLNPQQLQQLEALQGNEQLEALQQLLDQQQAEGETAPLPTDLSLRLTLEEPKICLKESGQMIMRGYGSILGWRQPIRMVVAPRASEGELRLDFVEGTLGPLPMPELIFDLIGSGLAKAILAGQAYAEITEISVGQGTLSIAGRVD